MMDETRPDVLRSVLDQEDAFVEGAEIVAAVLGAYLTECLEEFAGTAGHDARIGCPAWYRARILEWCAAPSVRALFGHEAVQSTCLAAQDLDDDDLQLVVGDLLERGGAGVGGIVPSSFCPRTSQGAPDQVLGQMRRLLWPR